MAITDWHNSIYSDRFKTCQKQLGTNLPLIGCISYGAFNLHVSLAKGLSGYEQTLNWGQQWVNCHSLRLCKWCGPRFATTLLLHSNVGIGVDLYQSRFMQAFPEQKRLLHTCYLTVMFNFGSILLVAATKSYLPRLEFLKGIYAILVSVGLISIGLDLLSGTNQTNKAK